MIIYGPFDMRSQADTKKSVFSCLILSLTTLVVGVVLFSDFIYAGQNKKITYMFYFGGDNNLSPYMEKNINDILKANVSSDVGITILFDGQKTTTRGFVKNNSFISEKISLFDSSKKENLVNFVLWSAENQKAEKYAIVIGAHGRGWMDYYTSKGNAFKNSLITHKSILVDEKAKSEMKLNDLVSAFELMNKAGVSFELIGFDACLMGMAEVFYPLSVYSKVLVGSQTSVPGYGWNYKEILENDNYSDGYEISKKIVTEFKEKNSEIPGFTSITAVDSSRFKYFIEKSFNSFVGGIYKSKPLSRAKYLNVVSKTLKIEPDAIDTYVDLGNFMNNVKDESSSAAVKALQDSIIAYVPNQDTKNGYMGVSIYAPTEELQGSYLNIQFSKSTLWGKYLVKILGVPVENVIQH